MVEIKINKEAEEYISKNNIDVLTIYVKVIPCGCARPIELPFVDTDTPEELENYHKQIVNGLTVYTSKQMTIPNNSIEVTVEKYAGETKLYPTGIEYFIRGVGNYCNLPEKENEL